jgi:serine/threonine protein phosphatase 1
MKKYNTYVIGDIHGGYLALKQVLQLCKFDYKNDTLIVLGDVVDGRSDVYNCVEELLKIKNRIDIMGNHDAWMVDFINTSFHPDSWSQGGLATAQSYADALGMELKVHKQMVARLRQYPKYNYTLNLIPEDITESHQNFYKKMIRYYKDDNNNVFVHGGVNRFQPIKDQVAFHMMWDRKLFNQAMSAKSGKTNLKWEFEEVNNVFIGHTTTQCWDTTEPIKASNVWNLDTGAGGDGKLTIMNVDTEEYWQSDLMNELYPDDTGRS